MFTLCIRLTRLAIPRSTGSFKAEALSFLSGFSARHCFGIWVSFISQITCLHSPANKSQLTSLRNLKIHYVFFCFLGGGFFLSANHGHRFASPLTHTWLIESGVLPCPSQLVLKRGLERDASLSIILLTTIVGWAC